MRIFRVQDAKGYGPYQNARYWEHEMREIFKGNDEHRARKHPTPYAEGKLGYIASDEVCGFRSLTSFRQWFSKRVLRAFLRHNPKGYALYEYEVPREAVRVGERQVLVLRSQLGNPVAIHDLRTIQPFS